MSLSLGKLSSKGMFLPFFFKNTALMGGVITDTFSLLFLLLYTLVSRDNMLQITSERPTCSTPRMSTVTKTFWKWYWHLFISLPCYSAKQGTISPGPHLQYRISHLTRAVLTDGMHICSSHFPVPLPFFAVTPWDTHKPTTGRWEISKTKSKLCKNQINDCNSTATDLLLFLNVYFWKYHIFQNL